MVMNMQTFLIGIIFIGMKNRSCGFWVDLKTKIKLNKLIKRMWKKIAETLGPKNITGDNFDDGVDTVPIPIKTRIIYIFFCVHVRLLTKICSNVR